MRQSRGGERERGGGRKRSGKERKKGREKTDRPGQTKGDLACRSRSGAGSKGEAWAGRRRPFIPGTPGDSVSLMRGSCKSKNTGKRV